MPVIKSEVHVQGKFLGGNGEPHLTGRLPPGQLEILQQVFDLIILSGTKVQIHNNNAFARGQVQNLTS